MEEPRRLGGRYELGGVLGRGGMAEVYLAHDTRLGRSVAVKTLRADMARDPSFQARFRREAQSAASLNHPAIVAVYDTGEDYIDGISIPYIVMEYVEGPRCGSCCTPAMRLLPERSLEMTIGILQALEYSHRVRHRAPRHQARQRDADAAGQRQGHGLRHRPGHGRRRDDHDADLRRHRDRPVPLPRAGQGRAGRRPLGPLLHRLPAVRAADRAAAVRRRLAGRGGLPARPGGGAAAVRVRSRSAPRDRRDRAEGARQGPRLPVPERRRDARRHRALPRRPPGGRRPAGRRLRDGRRGRVRLRPERLPAAARPVRPDQRAAAAARRRADHDAPAGRLRPAARLPGRRLRADLRRCPGRRRERRLRRRLRPRRGPARRAAAEEEQHLLDRAGGRRRAGPGRHLLRRPGDVRQQGRRQEGARQGRRAEPGGQDAGRGQDPRRAERPQAGGDRGREGGLPGHQRQEGPGLHPDPGGRMARSRRPPRSRCSSPPVRPRRPCPRWSA